MASRRQRTLLWAFLIVGAAALLRLAVCSVPRLNVDEGWLYYLCRNPLEQALWYMQKDRWPPLGTILFKGWMALVGSDEVWLRSLPAAIATLNVYLAFVLGRRLFDDRVGLGAATLSAISFLQWEYDTWLKAYGLLTCATLASTLFFLALMETRSRHRILWASAYVCSAAVLIYTHYIGVICLAAQFSVACIPEPRPSTPDTLPTWLPVRARMRWLLPCYGLTGLLFLPWLPILRLQLARRIERGDMQATLLPMLALETWLRFLPLITGLDNGPTVLSRLTDPALPVGTAARLGFLGLTTALLLWMCVRGATQLRAHVMSRRLALGMLGPAVLFLVLVAVKVPELLRPRYYVPYVPFIGMFLTAALLTARGVAKAVMGVLAGLVVLVNLSVLGSYLQGPYFRSGAWYEAARYARQHQGQAQIIVGHDPYMMHAFNFYYAGERLHYDITQVDNPQYTLDPAYFERGGLPQYRAWSEEVPNQIEERLKGIDVAIFILYYDFGGPVTQWLGQHYGVAEEFPIPNYSLDGTAEAMLIRRFAAGTGSAPP